ncbi:TonB-dependent siderophore receptor [Methylomonas sp. MK1]|uniref:TonB-dependent siderophore receptor n=1 Tax=Methylomonas sp. MK1 TaxID=1131552 RepID=UPI0003A8A952|nr:TonB-dependent receptor [Methylomonas sp. MK1]
MRTPTFATMTAPFAITALALSIASHTVHADTAQDGARTYAIAAGGLTEALTSFADQANLKLVFNADLTRGLTAPALNETVTVEQGLSKLLKDSGLGYRLMGNDTAIIEAKPAVNRSSPQSAATMPTVTVLGKTIYEATDPYNADYVVPSASAGTKIDTPVMETPLNVQSVSKQVLKDQQVITLDQALKNVSGVTTNSSGGLEGGFFGGTGQSIILRGFESQTYFRNGFRLQQGASSREMANVESVEVLKGPAAILYGLVEPGGMVNVVTKQPLATPYYAASQQFGSYDHYRTTLDATGPLNTDKSLLYRMNLSYQNSGSFRDFVGKEDVFVAPVLKWQISPKTQATLELEYNHQHLGLDTAFVPLFDRKLFDIPRRRNYSEYTPTTRETVYGGLNWSHQFNDDWSIKHSFAVNQQTIDNPHFVYPVSADNASVTRQLWGVESQFNTYSTNIDLTGHFDTGVLAHTVLLGGDYYRLDNHHHDATSFADPANFIWDNSLVDLLSPNHPGTPFTQPLQLIGNSDNRTDQFGFYIQDQIKLPFDLHIMGGIRYQNLHQHNLTEFGDIFGGGTDTSASSNDAVTPRVGILWQAQNWLSLYANYVESFGPNTANARLESGKPVPPTSAEQYEGGIKTEFFDGRLRATFAYYDLTKSNVATASPTLAAQGLSVITGAVRSRGPEVDVQGEILPGWHVIATYAHTDARIAKSDDEGYQAVGTRFWNVPTNTGSFWNVFEFLEGDLRSFKVGGGVTLRDGQRACCDKPALTTPGYATLDLLAAYSINLGKSKITAQLNINNLLDKHHFTGLNTISDASSGIVDFGQPRSFVGSINIQY